MPKTPIHRIERDQMNPDFQAIWDKNMQRTGDATLIEVMANAPALARYYFDGFYCKVFHNGDGDMRKLP